MLEQPSCAALIPLDDEDNEIEKGQQQQEAGEDREQGPVTVIQAVTATLMTMATTSKTTTRVEAYNLPSSAGCLPPVILL